MAFKTILGTLSGIFVLAIAWLFQLFPPEGKLIIYAIIVFVVPICVFYGLLYGINLTGIGGVKNWIRIIQELKVLKEEGIQKPLLELKEISDVIKILKQDIVDDLEIIPNYQAYLQTKTIKSRWVFGMALYHTVNNLEANLIPYLDKGIKCIYLCGGERSVIESRAKQIAKKLYQKHPKYLTEKNLKISWCESYHIPLPMEIYNAEEDEREVLITLPYELETIMDKKCAILIKDKEAAQQCVEKFMGLWDKYSNNELNLLELVEKSLRR